MELEINMDFVYLLIWCRHHQCCQHSSGNRVCLLLVLSHQMEKCRKGLVLIPSQFRLPFHSHKWPSLSSQWSWVQKPTTTFKCLCQWHFWAAFDIAECVLTPSTPCVTQKLNLSPFSKGSLLGFLGSHLFYSFVRAPVLKSSDAPYYRKSTYLPLTVPLSFHSELCLCFMTISSSLWERGKNISLPRKYYWNLTTNLIKRWSFDFRF